MVSNIINIRLLCNKIYQSKFVYSNMPTSSKLSTRLRQDPAQSPIEVYNKQQ